MNNEIVSLFSAQDARRAQRRENSQERFEERKKEALGAVKQITECIRELTKQSCNQEARCIAFPVEEYSVLAAPIDNVRTFLFDVRNSMLVMDFLEDLGYQAEFEKDTNRRLFYVKW
jgi:hypothetical protein